MAEFSWDPAQYGRFGDERGRPFRDLVSAIGASSPRTVVDLGCGPGELTASLTARWPTATVIGIDSSPEMISRASALAGARLRFELGDIASYPPAAGVDVVVSNAAFQWVPGHREVIDAWAAALAPGAWLAFQVPGNFSAPSHELMRTLASSPRWASQLTGVLRHHDAVGSPAEYATRLLDAGWQAQAWETTYLHLLQGPDPVVEWVRGTGLRPILGALPEADAAEFEAQYRELAREAYPPTEHGTFFEFRRIFCVAHKP